MDKFNTLKDAWSHILVSKGQIDQITDSLIKVVKGKNEDGSTMERSEAERRIGLALVLLGSVSNNLDEQSEKLFEYMKTNF